VPATGYSYLDLYLMGLISAAFKELDPIPQFRATDEIGRVSGNSVLTVVLTEWRYRPVATFLYERGYELESTFSPSWFSTSSFCQPGDGVQKLLWWTISVLVDVVADESRSGVQLAVPTWNTYFCIA
jgi:hypothetical protein